LIKATDRTEFKATNTIAKRKKEHDKESEYITRHEIIFGLYGSGGRCSLSHLKPTGYVMHQQFNISTIARSAHTVFMCFVFI